MCRSSYWSDLTAQIPRHREPYVLVYMLNENPRMVEYAGLLAREQGMMAKIITFNPLKKAPDGLEAICLPSPEEWVAAFRDASDVVTDSFHGTCFSLLFEKPMVVFNPPRFSVRLADVLADFGLSERRVADGTPANEVRVHERTIDWDAVRRAKQGFSAEAKRFLDACFAEGVAGAQSREIVRFRGSRRWYRVARGIPQQHIDIRFEQHRDEAHHLLFGAALYLYARRRGNMASPIW